jgi:hypothetical protein
MADEPVKDAPNARPTSRFGRLLAAGAAVVSMALTSACSTISVSTPGGTVINGNPGGISGSTRTTGGSTVGGSVGANGQICPSVNIVGLGAVSLCTTPGAIGGGAGGKAPDATPGGKRPGL